ncbi:MAG: hypothetical protein F6K06_10955 [Okeania sp. SIO1H4]|uniref:Ribbon-helix-helix protein, CopG family n=2 Tax=Microcoleaceae TaxID=1892252 RepID=A0A3N6PHY2_9CYAN|nr:MULTISPECIES: hypothetical protein [unclassified Okeania]NEP40992.1 hypothetical protein [Okeania sp. SIO2H7]NEP80429.1 hypothetical protein [Okeania sp. SIO3B3]NER05019.1 hypothetical protein [Okeania sp. SIO3C4]NES76292.1 hypothetical protein [Okeania sp. SIO1H4]RQH06205.1 hypothetical protein D4Z78_30250 [Okeania hirsuta]
MPKSKHKEHGQYKMGLSVSVTPEAAQGLMEQAKKLGLSRSALLEKIGRGEIQLNFSSVEQLGKFSIA